MKSEFLIASIETGQLNAMVKNIMLQTGIEDPKEAVRMLNSGELEIFIKRKPILERLFLDRKIFINNDQEEGVKLEVHVYELKESSTFSEIAKFFNKDFKSLRLDKNQIDLFCKNNLNCLSRAGINFFICKEGENSEFSISKVVLDSSDRFSYLSVFDNWIVLDAKHKHRFIVANTSNDSFFGYEPKYPK